MSTQHGLSRAHVHGDNVSLVDLRLLRKDHPNAKNYQFHSSIKHQHIKTQLDGMCSIFSTLRPHLCHKTYTAYTLMTPPELAMLQYSCRNCCCPHTACTPLVFILQVECCKKSPMEVKETSGVGDKLRSPTTSQSPRCKKAVSEIGKSNCCPYTTV